MSEDQGIRRKTKYSTKCELQKKYKPLKEKREGL